ncbi:MAG: hypothetical protein WCJ30_22420 [Deltaproteobacteria bacterium]
MSTPDGTTFAARMRAAVERLKANSNVSVIDAEFGEPLTDAELAEVQSRLGFELDPRFVAYFRAVNGIRLSWVTVKKPKKGAPGLSRDEAIAQWVKFRLKGGTFGGVNIPRLKDTFTAARPGQIGAGTKGAMVPILGGWSDVDLRARLRLFDAWEYLLPVGDGGFDVITILASPTFQDPVVLRASDHGAALSDHRTMRARSYLELMAVTVGNHRRLQFLASQGAPGDHAIVELTADDFGPDVDVYDPDDGEPSGVAAEHIGYALGLAGLCEVQPRPVRWLEEALNKKDAAKVRAKLEASALEPRVVDHDGGWSMVFGSPEAPFARVEFSRKALVLRMSSAATPDAVAALRGALG